MDLQHWRCLGLSDELCRELVVMSNWLAIIAATRLESSGTILITSFELHRALVLYIEGPI